MPHVAAGHADLREDPRRDEILPALPAHRLDQLTGDQIEHVVVRVRAAEARRQRNEAESPGNLLAVVRRLGPPQQIPGAKAEPAAMHEEIAHRQLAGDVRIRQREGRQVANDRRIPLDFVLLDEEAQRGRGESLGVGGNAEQGSGVDRRRLATPADAVSLRHHDAVAVDHRHADPRYLEGLHRPRDPGVEVRGLRERSGADDERQEEEQWGDASHHGARDYTAGGLAARPLTVHASA